MTEVQVQNTDRDNSIKNRDEYIDNLHSKRRKDVVLLRTEQAERQEILHGYRENSSRRKTEKDDIPDQRKRDDQRRSKDDNLYNLRYQEKGLFHRERGESQRDRDEWRQPKHPQDETSSKRESDEGPEGLKSVQAAEEKAWASQSRGEEEYKIGTHRDYYAKDAGRHSEQPKRRDALENGSLTMHEAREDVHARDNHDDNQKKARHEISSTRDGPPAHNTNNPRVLEK